MLQTTQPKSSPNLTRFFPGSYHCCCRFYLPVATTALRNNFMALLLFFISSFNHTFAQIPGSASIHLTGEPIPKSNSITKSFINIYVTGEKCYASIPVCMLGRQVLLLNRVVKAPSFTAAPGEMMGEQRVIRFVKASADSIAMEQVFYNVPAVINALPIKQPSCKTLAVFSKKSIQGNASESIIDISSEIIDGTNFTPNETAKKLLSIKADSVNIDINALRVVDGHEMEIITSLLLLPLVPMPVRQYDQRIGFHHSEYAKAEDTGSVIMQPVWRWRMQPREADIEKYKRGESVEPVKPVVIYIDPATPARWIPYFVNGINDWQPVFENAGFKNAILAKLAPKPAEDSNWILMGAGHSAIVYIDSKDENATGKPGAVDPRSGEILETHICWYSGMEEQLRNWYLVKAGPNDTRARKLIFEDTLMGRLIRETVTHEVGHSLGLIHNIGASSCIPVDSLRNKQWVKANGITASVMDYTRCNYVAQPKDSLDDNDLLPHIGGYDYWAIEWGYRFFSAGDAAVTESNYPDSIVNQKLKDHRYWFYKEFNNPDPRAQTEDVGDDAIAASGYGIENLKRVIEQLSQWINGDNVALKKIYSEIINRPSFEHPSQYVNYILHVLKIIGGSYINPAATESNSAALKPLPAQRQRAAMNFLSRQLFTTPYWLFPPVIIKNTGDDPLMLTGAVQYMALQFLLNRVLPKLPLKGDANIYSIDSLLNDLQKGIWGELYTSEPIDSFRSNLQNNYTRMLSGPEIVYGNPYLKKLVKKQFNRLKNDIQRKLLSTKEEGTVKHLESALKIISEKVKDL